MRFWLLCISFVFCVNSNAQLFHSYFDLDSIRISDRIGGDLDSIDLITKVHSSALPGGGINLNENMLSSNFLLNNHGGQQFFNYIPWRKMRFSGLPHIGFAYSFGGKGTQFVQAEYQQQFKHSVLLNIDFKKYRSNGFLRSSDFSHNDVQIQLDKKGKIYSLELKGSYESSDVSQSGGLLFDSLSNEFDLIFIPVKKENAKLNTQRSRVYNANYFDFIKDSIKSIGLYTQHELHIKKLKYFEVDTLAGIYPMINYSVDTTYDQHQWSQVSNGAGIFSLSKNHFFKAGLNSKYWNFQNLGRFRDTVEINLFSELNIKIQKTALSNHFDFNLLGAKNEFSNHLEIGQKLNRLNVKGVFHIENKLPDYYQRYAYGNNYNTNLVDFDKQQRISIGGQAETHLGPIDVSVKYAMNSVRNNYFFIENAWRNDTLNSVTFNQLSFRLGYKLKALSIQPSYTFTLTEKSLQLIPTHMLQARVMVKGGLFKAKKLIAYSGIDFSLMSSFQRMGYYSMVGVYDFKSVSTLQDGFSNLHAFAGFQIDEFKFFVRFENIGYFWNDHNTTLITGYPIPSTNLRVGLTWDFFN